MTRQSNSLFEPAPAMALNCCMCGRFVSTADCRRHVEMGDYGTIYSVEFECPPGKGCNADTSSRERKP